MSYSMRVLTGTDMPSLDALEAESLAEGHNHVRRLLQDWASCENRFDQDGEVLLGVRAGQHWVAVGGLNQDPYVSEESIGRLRHLYVAQACRREGVGRALVVELERKAAESFRELRLRTKNPAASQFYVSLGFESVVDEPLFTHRRWLRPLIHGT